MKKVAVKFCGGCDPGYDRVDYLERIRAGGENHIEWVAIDNSDFDALLLINGCQRACAEKDLKPVSGQVTSVKDSKSNPDEIVKMLLK